MRVIKIISCAVLCAFIILFSCFPAFAADTGTSTKPIFNTAPWLERERKSYSKKTEAELLSDGQVPISDIIKLVQSQIDKTVKDDKTGEEIRLYDFSKNTYNEETEKYQSEKVPVGKFNLSNFLQDKYFVFYYTYYTVGKDNPLYVDDQIIQFPDKKRVFIDRIEVFDTIPFVDVKQSGTATRFNNYQPGALVENFILYGKPSYVLAFDFFSTTNPLAANQRFGLTYGGNSNIFDSSTGKALSLVHANVKVSSTSGIQYSNMASSFYINFMPEGGEGILDDFVVTDKDISSEKQYIDDPDRPDGSYKYAVYEFQGEEMIAAQYFKEKPEVYKKDSGSSVQYEVLFNRFKAESGEIIDRQNWEFWMPENETYIWLTVPNSYSTPSKTPATYHYTDNSPDHTSVKFSWEPFTGYDGEIYQDNAVLVDGNGFVAKRPTGSYPYVIKRYVNSQLYETFFFQYAPYVNITDVKKNYDAAVMTAKIFVCNVGSSDTGGRDNLWYSKKQDVFFVPSKSGSRVTQLRETYDISIHYVNGVKSGNYLTFNWDAGKASDEANQFALFYEKNGDNLDGFYEEFENGITDGEGNPVGQGDGSKPGKNDGSGFDFGDFEFNSDSLWKYATEFLNFCKNTFAVLPSFIWQIIGTGAVIVVVLRILGR